MSCLDGLLREHLVEGEQALRKALRLPFLSAIMRGYLPQTWIVTTDQESLAVHADGEGHITVLPGSPVIWDGSIAMRHDVLADLLRTGRPPQAHDYRVTFQTDKGKAAFEHLASYFGLTP